MKRMTEKIVMTGAIVSSLACLMATSNALAEEEKPTADFTTGIYSQYIWRGYELSKDSVVIQPSVSVAYKGFGAGLWGNLDTDQTGMETESFNWNETDLTLSYDGSRGIVGYSVGYIYYDLDGLEDTQELYFGLSVDTLLSPSFTFYKDIANVPGWYATLGISHSFPLNETLALDLGAQIGFLDDDADYSELHDGLLSASVSIPVSDYFTITPELYYSFALSSKASDLLEAASIDGTDDNFLYGGVSLSLAF